MKTNHFSFHCLLLTLSACSLMFTSLNAQKPDKQLWFQWDDVVYPAKVSEYAEAAKAVNEFLKEQNYPFPMNAYSSDDFHFYYVMPISSYAAIDTMEMMWTEMFQKVGEEKMTPLGKAFIGTQESGLNRIFVHRPDLSYWAESGSEGENETNFALVYFSYPIYGMAKQFEEVCLKWVDLHKSKNTDFFYDFFEVLVGEEGPCYFFVSWSENAASYYSKNMELWKEIKEEGEKLQQEMFSLLRKVDVKHLWYREDLSYNPGD